MANEMALQGLLHQRARRRGDVLMISARLVISQRALAKAEAQFNALAAETKSLAEKLQAAESDISTLTTTLALVFNHDHDDDLARKTVPKDHLTKWGGLTREILSVLRQVEMADADAITLAVASNLGIDFDPTARVKPFRRKIGRTLNGMFRRGLLERHHSLDKKAPGLWSLKALDA